MGKTLDLWLKVTYKLAGASIKSFGGITYLSVGENCTITRVDDIIGQIADMEINENGKIIEGEIDVVSYSEEYYGCLICTAKVNTDDNVIAKCSKCDAMMKLSKCSEYATAQVDIAATNDEVHKVTLFHNAIMSIIQLDGVSGDNIARKLLSAPPLRLNVDHRDVILSVSKL